MSLIINNILDPNDVGTVLSGSLGLFAGPGDVFYAKKIRWFILSYHINNFWL